MSKTINNLNKSLAENITPDKIGAATSSDLDTVKNNIGTVSNLQTENKNNLVSAINELFQSANNGKELIASAIGEPLSSNQTFQAMSNDINGLLSTFKTNMMNSGVVVENGDKFKQLIDKIKGLTEGEGDKGIKFANGIDAASIKATNTTKEQSVVIPINLDFVPTYIFVFTNYLKSYTDGECISEVRKAYISSENQYPHPTTSLAYIDINNITKDSFTITAHNTNYSGTLSMTGIFLNWYAIGIGEEDTTLRDSLASILTEEGVNVSEEDDMASLISKVDSEFTKDNNTISEMEANNETNRQNLITALRNNGKELTGNESFEELVGMVEVEDGVIISPKDIKQIACGQYYTIILKNDGSVWSCGNNQYGQLGLGGTNTTQNKFTQVTTNINNDVKEVVCGHAHTFILKNDGSVWSCGYNNYGQLGLGDTTDRTSFTKVTTNISNVKQIACGNSYTFILKNDGSVWACGKNNNGQLGLGDSTARYTFTQVTTNINNDVKQISCGQNHTFIIKNDGSVWSCGYNNQGQLGLGDTADKHTFTQVTTNINNDVKQISCGYYNTFIIKNDGSVWACGRNDSGQLGLNDTNNKLTFTKVTTNISNDVKQIVCSGDHTYMLKNDGSVWSCGINTYGQLGLGNTTSTYTFTKVTTNINNDMKQIACGGYHTIILKNDGSLWACGYNTNGQLGLNDTTNRNTFTQSFKALSLTVTFD